MSVYHGVRDIEDLDGPAFFRAAKLLPAYDGAVLNAALKQAKDEQKQAESKPLTLEQLQANFPAAPQLGEEVPMFEVARCT